MDAVEACGKLYPLEMGRAGGWQVVPMWVRLDNNFISPEMVRKLAKDRDNARIMDPNRCKRQNVVGVKV